MNIFNDLKQQLIEIIQQLKLEGIISQLGDFANITVEAPRDKAHGDISTNAAMALAKPNSLDVQTLARSIASELEKLTMVLKVEISRQGFINITLKNHLWYEILSNILKFKESYGESTIGANQKINLEYVSVNPTGPMHIGHARAAIFGDALASLLIKCGYNITKEYYINDAGKQIDCLVQSAYLRYKEQLGEEVVFTSGLYPGDYLINIGKILKDKFGSSLKNCTIEQIMPLIRQLVIDHMMDIIKEDLSLMGIKHDVFTSEYKLHQENKISLALEILKEKDLVYKGKLEIPKGKKEEDWEEREQLLFKSTNYGDDLDRPLQKSDGRWTYFAADLAYILDKLERGYHSLIMVLGADHIGYVKRTIAGVKALSDEKTSIDIKICQLVKFMQDQKPIKMSKRAGTFITVREVLDLVGKDAMRFMMLTRKNDIEIDFDIAKVKEQSKDNPVFYVQYAHARCQSILRTKEISLKNNEQILEKLHLAEEMEIIKFLATWPKIVENAAIHHEPHRIVFYLHDLASLFHSLWHKGKTDKNLRFIIDDHDLKEARIMLIQAIAIVIRAGLFILNVKPVDEM